MWLLDQTVILGNLLFGKLIRLCPAVADFHCSFSEEALRILGDHYFAKGAYGEAIDHYEQLLYQDISHLTYVVDNYAAALEQLGEAETAEELWRVYAEISQEE